MSRSDRGGISVLVVDDDPDNRATISDFLEDEAFAVATAANGREALTHLRAHPSTSVVLLDLTMPVMDGFQFRLEQLGDPAIDSIPVVVMTARDSVDRGTITADEILPKPLDLGRLLDALRRSMKVPRAVGSRPVSGSHDFLTGGGEMGERIRSLDWSKTPLGPVDRWPQSLRTAISMMLPSKAQICFFWGPEFAVVYNDAYRPVFGEKHPRMLGQPGSVAWSEVWDAGVNLHGLLAGVVRTGEAFSAQDLLFVIERHGFVEETYFDVSYDPVRVESGEVGGVYCIVTETSGRVVGERRLALLRDLAAQNSSARSAREACTLAMGTLAAKPFDVRFALAYLDGELQACTPGAEAALAAAPTELIKELPLDSGSLVVGVNPMRPFDEQHRAFLDLVAGQLATAIANAQVHEQERRRAEALAEIDRAKTAFFSNVSHEFRTPLTLMMGPLEGMLENSDSLPLEARTELDVVRRNAVRLLKLVNTLLDFSRIEAGRVQAVYEPTDLAQLTADLASAFRSATDRAGLTLSVDCPPLSEPAWVDRDMWEKIVLNLLSNAFKFTFQGEIKVSLREEDALIKLEVSDTGTGIPPHELPNLFERFHRVQGTRARTHEGSGIGLALVQELAQLHGGNVSVASELTKGTVFDVTIPRGSAHLPEDHIGAGRTMASTSLGPRAFVQEALSWLPDSEPTTERIEEHPGTVGAPVSGAPILVADDNADMRDYLQRLLSGRWEVKTVPNGLAALEAARMMRPELVLTDVMMPELDGFGLLRELRADPALASVPVIMLSARAGESARVEGLEAGADDYLVKPFSAREVIARVGSQLALARLRAQAQEEREARFDELQRSVEFSDMYVGVLGHDLRNPLSGIITAASLILARSGSSEQIARPANRILSSAERMRRMIEQILDFTRARFGSGIPVRRVATDLADVCRDAIDELEHGGTEAIRVDIVGPTAGEWDPDRLAQLLSNVLGNALTHGGRGRPVRVRIDGSDASRVRLEVYNEGTIPTQLLPAIFEPFHPHRDGSRDTDGLGLGLFIAKQIVVSHGGEIRIESSESEGTRCMVELPRRAPAEVSGATG